MEVLFLAAPAVHLPKLLGSILEILLWLCLAVPLLSYGLYPLVVRLAAKRYAQPVHQQFGHNGLDDWPPIDLLLAAHNEEAVIENKVRNLLDTDYPAERVRLWVGADACTDQTDSILQRLAQEFPNLHHRHFAQRTGKPGIINALASQCTAPLLVLTDAKAQFDRQTLPQLVAWLADPAVGLVSGLLINGDYSRQGVARAEKSYFGWESRLKEAESRLWGAMIGAYGSAYALKRPLYQPPPPHFLVDDLYISLQVLAAYKRCLFNPAARCYLDVSSDWRREFKRKKRIGAGNFQNLRVCWRLFFRGLPRAGSAFFFHKVLRWCTPFALLLSLPLLLVLALGGLPVYQILLGSALALGLLVLLEQAQPRLGVWAPPLRLLGHFVRMNLALLAGFLQFARGIRQGVWEPTARKALR